MSYQCKECGGEEFTSDVRGRAVWHIMPGIDGNSYRLHKRDEWDDTASDALYCNDCQTPVEVEVIYR